LKRQFDKPGIAAVEAAKQVHRIGEIARRIRPHCFEEAVEVRMARTTAFRDAD